MQLPHHLLPIQSTSSFRISYNQGIWRHLNKQAVADQNHTPQGNRAETTLRWPYSLKDALTSHLCCLTVFQACWTHSPWATCGPAQLIVQPAPCPAPSLQQLFPPKPNIRALWTLSGLKPGHGIQRRASSNYGKWVAALWYAGWTQSGEQQKNTKPCFPFW